MAEYTRFIEIAYSKYVVIYIYKFYLQLIRNSVKNTTQRYPNLLYIFILVITKNYISHYSV